MKCQFCNAEESCFVELFTWDFTRQRARELLLQGVCTMHANDTGLHPSDESVNGLHPKFADRKERLAHLHWKMFGNACDIPLDPDFLRFGQRYWPLNSPQGEMVRAARGHHIDVSVAEVGGPVDEIAIERVPDKAALDELVRDAAKQ